LLLESRSGGNPAIAKIPKIPSIRNVSGTWFGLDSKQTAKFLEIPNFHLVVTLIKTLTAA
jgi:hypothetical protein